MRKVSIILMLLLTILPLTYSFEAKCEGQVEEDVDDSDEEKKRWPSKPFNDDSCTYEATIGNYIVGNLTSLGLYSGFSNAFHMRKKADGEGVGDNDVVYKGTNIPIQYEYDETGKVKVDKNGKPIKVLRCQIPTKDIRFVFKGWYEETIVLDPNDNKDHTSFAVFPPVYFYAEKDADRVCVRSYWPYVTWGCKYRPCDDPKCNPTLEGAGCYAGASCTSKASRYSKNVFSITGAMMQCVKETVNKVFVDPAACADGLEGGRINMFPAFQDSMRQTVKLALTLYVIFFGIKVALGQEMPTKQEYFIFFMKLILVLYFSVGIYQGISQGKAMYEDGITTWVLPGFLAATNSIARMVFQAGGQIPICTYDYADYAPGYSYLALWDSLDCRIMYYLGFNDPTKSGAVALSALFKLIIPTLLSFNLPFLILLCCFSIFFISIAIYFVHINVIAIIAIGIVTYFGPLFVPMALFKYTKQYFDSWVKLLFSFCLQPAVVAAFLALMITVFDKIFYGDCAFTLVNGVAEITKASASLKSCSSTFGYNLFMLTKGGGGFISMDVGFFTLTLINPAIIGKMFQGLAAVTLFSFLFYHFANLLSYFAADLTGGPALGNMAIKPNFVVDTAIDVATKIIDAKTGGAASKAKAATSRAGVSASGPK